MATPATEASAPLFVVVNPSSGSNDSARVRELLSQVFDQAGRAVTFIEVADPGQLASVFDQVGAQAREAGGIVVAVGGDGTINAAANAAIAHGCPLGVIPQGTFNLLARDHGIPTDAEAAARALVRAKASPVQVGSVNGHTFHVNASLGLYPQLLQDREAFNAQLWRTPWVAVLSALVTLFKWRKQLILDVECDGQRTVLRTPMLFVANNRLQMERIGLDVAEAAGTAKGRLAGVVTRPVGSWAMLGLVLRGALGRLGEADHVQEFSFQKLEVKVRGRRQVKVATDGEVRIVTPPLTFAVGSEPLLLMVPAAEDRAPRE